MARYTVYLRTSASFPVEVEVPDDVDPERLDPQELADQAEAQDWPGLCHHCAHHYDIAGDGTAIEITSEDNDYERVYNEDTGEWTDPTLQGVSR